MGTTLIIPAAGSGSRLAAGVPKAFVRLAGRTLLEHSVDRARRAGVFDRIVVAVPAGLVEQTRVLLRNTVGPGGHAGQARRTGPEVIAGGDGRDGPCPALRPEIIVVAGGGERTDTVVAALAADSVGHETGGAAGGGSASDAGTDVVLVHDAARALTPAAVHRRVLEAVRSGALAVVPTLPVVDTIRRVRNGELVGGLDRAALRRVQTPQGFDRELLIRAHRAKAAGAAHPVTDDAGLVESLGTAVHEVQGSELAMKITYPRDLDLARVLLEKERTP